MSAPAHSGNRELLSERNRGPNPDEPPGPPGPQFALPFLRAPRRRRRRSPRCRSKNPSLTASDSYRQGACHRILGQELLLAVRVNLTCIWGIRSAESYLRRCGFRLVPLRSVVKRGPQQPQMPAGKSRGMNELAAVLYSVTKQGEPRPQVVGRERQS